MNWQHFQAFLWLRWRLLVNQMRKSGTVSVVILFLVAMAGLVAAVGLFFVLFFVGLLVLPEAPSPVVMYVWDGLVVGFLFAWCIGVISELQRSEVLSLEKFLHLPVSLKGAFLINYLSSLISVSLILFLPAMLGLSLGLVFSKGPAMLLVFPLLAAFLLMVTALTYQFQSWLASLMVNKRRRRTVIAIVTVAFVLLCQTPNLINVLRPWEGTLNTHKNELKAQLDKQQADLQRDLAAGKIMPDEFRTRHEELEKEYSEQAKQEIDQTWDNVERITRLFNLVLPPGWLPLGAQEASERNVLPALLGTLGLGLIGTASLWRSYRTTVRLYTGHFTRGGKQPVAVAAPRTPAPIQTAFPPARFLEKSLPWQSEQTSVIALGGFRSLLRAPEAKMLLMTPVIMVVVFGSLLAARATPPPATRPLIAFGAMAMLLLTLVQLVGNQFGFDRGGFRVFVLCPARRRDILLGKNLAVAPLALGMCAVAVAVVQFVYPMRVDYFLAACVQAVSMFLLFCLLANGLSMLAPLPIAPGSIKPMSPKGIALLLHFAFMFVFPVTMATTLLPLGIGLGLDALEWSYGIPIALILAVAECVAIVFLYRFLLTLQGRFLQAREQKILESVTTKAE